MNLNLQQILAKYTEKFEMVNDADHDENYKWQVVKEFRELMDVALKSETSEFADALYKVKTASKNIIDSYTQPFHGLVEFARKEPETVRKMFVDLYADDGADLERQETLISDFFAKSNELLNKYYPGSYRFKQNSHSVSAYLFLYDPDHHFMYKATQAGIFADCIGFYDDWGSGDNIKLEPFYRMCNELVEAIKQDKALIKTNESRFDGRLHVKPEDMFADAEKHLLAFDIIYCSSVYGLYEGMSFRRPKTKEKQLYMERKKKAEQFLEEYNEAVKKKELLQEALEYIKTEMCPGTEISHEKYGNGKIESIEEGRLVIFFTDSNKHRQFGLTAVIGNQLIKAGERFQKEIVKYLDVLKKKNSINSAVSHAKAMLEPYAEYLE